MPTPRTSIPSSLRRSGAEAPPAAIAVTAATARPPKSSYIQRRSFIYAAGFAIITIAGTLIGATLKSRTQAEEKMAVKQQQPVVQVDVGQQIAVLEETKLNLMQRRGQLEKKILEVRERERKEVERREERTRLRKTGEELKREMAVGRGSG